MVVDSVIELNAKQWNMMKNTRTLIIVAVLSLGLAPVTGHSQTQSYFYSGPVSGFEQVGLTPDTTMQVNTGFLVVFGTVTETLNYNPVAQTLQEVGSVTISPSSSGTFNLLGDSTGFPGTQPVLGSASLAVGNNGCFSFDYTYSLPSGPQAPLGNLGILMPVAGTANYQGQNMAGTWDLVVPAYPTIIAVTPSSLTFSEGDGGTYLLPGPQAMPGLVGGVDNDTYYASWNVSGVATAIPEPSSLALLGLGLSALAFLRRS
jgi:hypothetical protein